MASQQEDDQEQLPEWRDIVARVDENIYAPRGGGAAQLDEQLLSEVIDRNRQRPPIRQDGDEKAAGQYPAAYRAQNCLLSKMASSAPVNMRLALASERGESK
jgi:hypothetical protein